MHAIKVLEEDHGRIEILLEELSQTAEEATQAKGRLFERLEKELIVHILAEDNIFLPHVEDAIEDSKKVTTEFFNQNADVLREAAELISASYKGHREITTILEAMKSFEVGDKNWESKNTELHKTVTLQINKEEELFPRAQKILEAEDFERIGNLIEHCKWQVRGMAQARLASSASLQQRLERGLAVVSEGAPGEG